jgi:predicted alpha/beta hydrolase family esterase
VSIHRTHAADPADPLGAYGLATLDPTKPDRVVVLHGTKGSPDGNWFPWLKTQVESLGVACAVPTLPTPEGHTLEAWQVAFAEQVGDLGATTVLVGHSLGATFALRLLEHAPAAAVFLASTVTTLIGNEEYDALNGGFVASPFDWPAIEAHVPRRYVYHGGDDPYVPLASGEEVARKLSADLQVIDHGGHLNSESGYLEFPRLWSDLRTLLP